MTCRQMFFLKAEVFYGGINVVSSWAKWQARQTENTLTQLVFRFPCLYDSDVVKLEFSQSGGLSKDTLLNRPYVPTDWCTYS